MTTPLRFAVLGDPVGHSRSPAMHAAAFRALGLPHGYVARPTTADELPAVVQELRAGIWAGLNVTIPHKTAVLALVDEVHASAKRVGAANTLVRRDGRVVAHNTDAEALAAEIEALAGGRLSGRALVLGSGGAARAAVVAAESLGAGEVVVRARTRREGFAVTQRWAADAASESRTDLVVQATSAGMKGADPGEAVANVVDWSALPAHAVAVDVVYAPPVTPFLEAAARRGLRATCGLGMLARQGALAFELWLGVPAPLDVMLAAISGAS